MSEPTKYEGGCHCGQVRYAVTADLGRIMSCNCSICSKKGHLLTFVPADQFKLLSGEDALTDYQFNTRNVHHLFCKVCGVQSFGHGTGKGGKPMYSINVRCLDGVEPAGLSVDTFDGKSM